MKEERDSLYDRRSLGAERAMIADGINPYDAEQYEQAMFAVRGRNVSNESYESVRIFYKGFRE